MQQRTLALLIALHAGCADQVSVDNGGPDEEAADASQPDANAEDAALEVEALADAGLEAEAPEDAALDEEEALADAALEEEAPEDAALEEEALENAEEAAAQDAETPEDADTSSSEPIASSLVVVVNRDIDTAPTPINSAYVAEISSTMAGDRIISYQKYFKNTAIITALIDAARRGVEVTGIYREEVEPPCESFLEPSDDIDCSTMFVKASSAHHKNMMILRSNGTVSGLVGSYNLRERGMSDPRVHTVLSFDIANGQSVFDFYAADVQRMTGGQTTQPLTMDVAVAGGGNLAFTFHPGPSNPVLDFVNGINTCDGTLWLSYFVALADSFGRPVFDRLENLVNDGCDVRVLLDEANIAAQISLLSRGVPVRFPTFTNGVGTLGHKIVSVDSNGETHLIQGSANLEFVNHLINHNLTVYARVPTSSFTTVIDAELLRYW